MSFLRLGDFFQHVQLLRELLRGREQKITIAGFTELKPAVSLFPEFSFELVPRNEILMELTQRDFPWYRAGWILEQSLNRLKSVEWNLIANLSHTLFSARLMDCLSSREKWGVQFENGKSAGWNPWLIEMNNNWVSQQKPEFTYVETLAKAMGVTLSPAPKAQSTGREIWLQPLTSDEKKNWAMGNWQYIAKHLSKTHPVRVISAPSETKILEPWFSTVEGLSFSQIREQKENCRLIVSGDTSVIHFAALESIPTFGIYLGSANRYKTPPRQAESPIMTGNVPCYPCPHRSPCTQATHKCGEAVNQKDVLKLIEIELGGVHGERRRRASFEHTQEA